MIGAKAFSFLALGYKKSSTYEQDLVVKTF